ncbi:MAG: hypothetical protein F6K14_01555 [Symploca sp. SIO2C1]|nr:hypothetical protein [Symploca sp. SIO2C1]
MAKSLQSRHNKVIYVVVCVTSISFLSEWGQWGDQNRYHGYKRFPFN